MAYSEVFGKKDMAPEAVVRFLSEVKEIGLPLHSMLLLHNDRLIAEYYSAPYQKDALHRIYSESKSFVALAIGLLLKEGRLSLHDTIASHFPEKVPPNTDSFLLETTVQDLLMMAPPFDDECYDSLHGDVVEAFFKTRPTRQAGTLFCYNAASPAVLTALTEKLAGAPLLSYMWTRLLEPLGFSPKTWCVKMPQGLSWGASGIMCTPRDLMKIGQLLLHGGEWNGMQLLPEEYVRAACGRRIDSEAQNGGTESGFGYGYLIWRTRYNGFAFLGLGGQCMLCQPEKNIVLVTMADTQAIRGGSEILLRCFWRTIYASLQAEDCLNWVQFPASYELSLPLPAAGAGGVGRKDIWSREIAMCENPMGISQMRFEQEAGHIVWEYENKTGKHMLQLGLGCYQQQSFPEAHYYSEVVCREGNRKYRCQAGAVWSDANTLSARIYITDINVGTGKLVFHFEGDRVYVQMASYGEFFLTEYNGSGWGRFVRGS